MDNRALLYVEDEEDDVFLMTRAFKKTRRERCTLHAVSDGRMAIDYLSGVGVYIDRTAYPLPAAVLLDLNLPIKSGLEVLQWIRASAKFRLLPVVMFSSSNQRSDQEKSYALGANAYLIKPSVSAELERVIGTVQDFWLLLNSSPEKSHGDDVISLFEKDRTAPGPFS